MVEYGTNRDILSSESPSVEGPQNVALTNQSFSVSLTELFPDTVYFFRVVAINEIGPTNGDILSFMTLALGMYDTVNYLSCPKCVLTLYHDNIIMNLFCI